MSRLSQGIHGSGARDYNEDQYARVVASFKAAKGPVTVQELHLRTGVPGRAVREIMSAADGVDFLLGGDGNGYSMAEDAADAERLTRRFGSQVSRMSERIARRKKYAGGSDAQDL